MLHALANIEQWAYVSQQMYMNFQNQLKYTCSIDLAWDIMARFGPTNPNLPPAFFSDFTKMALDESKHLYAFLCVNSETY